jgi:hypothetical protein
MWNHSVARSPLKELCRKKGPILDKKSGSEMEKSQKKLVSKLTPINL